MLSMFRKPALWLARLDDWLFDFRFGTDTAGLVPCSEYEVVGENREHGTGFQSSRPGPFKKIMRSLGFPPNSVMVDVGSGKGRMVLIASDLGFRKVIGLEFVPSLCEIAQRNVELYRRKGKGAAEIEVHVADASSFEFSGDENVFYLANPFDGPLTRRFLDNIERSVRANPRKVWLVYMNPQEHKTVLDQGLFHQVAHHFFAGNGRDFRVYVNQS